MQFTKSGNFYNALIIVKLAKLKIFQVQIENNNNNNKGSKI